MTIEWVQIFMTELVKADIPDPFKSGCQFIVDNPGIGSEDPLTVAAEFISDYRDAINWVDPGSHRY